MAQANLERNTFVRGLITEASPLTFPENASIDEDNYVLNREGSRQRRLGMDYESLSSVIDTGKVALTFDNHAVGSFLWENVNNDPNLSLGVVQIGNNLWFVDAFQSSLSANLLNSGTAFVLDATTVGSNISGNTPIQFTAVNGVLLMVSREMSKPYYLTYDSVGDSLTSSLVDVRVRDIWGIDDGIDVDERPVSLSDKHNYNLLNQGWTATNINAVAYPSNSDVMSLGKDSSDNFSSALLQKQFFGNSPAAKGKFIIDPFARGSSRITESGIAGLPSDSDSGTFSSVAFYAGRAFYAGINSNTTDGDSRSPRLSGTIMFTQIIDSNDKLSRCYQEADPTSEHVSDLIATDGGTIHIPEAANILKMVTVGASLVVFAENGVWQITGPDNVFRADDFSVSEITNIGAVNAASVVNAEGNILYWSKGGIYSLQADQVSGRLQAQNLTETTIQTLYNNIEGVVKENVVGTYDEASRKISWLYSDDSGYDGSVLRNKYNRELTLDTVLGAFSTATVYDLSSNSPYIAGYLPTPNFLASVITQQVVANGDPVQVNGEDVVVSERVRSRGISQTKYLTIKPNAVSSNYGFTFSHYIEPDFLDWKTADDVGVDAAAFLITGYELFADSQRSKQVNYLTMHFKRTETGFEEISDGNLEATNASSCLIQAQWDFANSANSGKWGKQFQGYRLTRFYMPSGDDDEFDYGWAVITTKNRLRGSGRAISLRFDTEPGKDQYIYGWAVSVEGRRNV
jgi:hypothetical protein